VNVDSRWKFSAVIVSDVLFTAFSYWLAYFLRFNFSIPEVFSQKMIETLPVVLLVKISCYYFFGLYRGIWRYASMNDLARILKAATLSSILFGFYVVLRHRFIDFPRSVLIIDWLVIVTCLGGSRFLYRFFREFHGQKRSGDNRVLIIGADDTGEMLLREMRQNRKADYTPVGFLDKEPGKMGKYIHSVPILGGIEELDAVAAEKHIHEVIVASPSITGREMRKIVETCDRVGVRCKTVPPIGDILNGKVNVSQIREISIEDLLGREHIELDAEKIWQYLSGKKVMVTGAAGSIGRELCRQILKIGPKQLILFERAENELFYLDLEFAKRSLNGLYEAVLGDILDVGRLEWAMRKFRPDVVFHAAAYKHVPMQEAHPVEAIKNNIIGTRNVAEMSIKYGVEKFVMISTDKAVKPANVMGATKRIAEVICQEMNRQNRTKFVVVRFGNVLNSAGSVIPIFKEQILKGGPVTVTHPEATRYFMSIPEAAQLVMQAGAIGVGGEIFILDMGEPIKILDLARDMVRLMGLKVGEDIDIVYSGLRPGEKLHEKLATDEEKMEPTIHEKIMLVRSANHNWKEIEDRLTGLIAGVDESNTTHIKEKLFDLIPECSLNQTS
jgi:FlaA1/EpsC-like NDP-sugar epimerase